MTDHGYKYCACIVENFADALVHRCDVMDGEGWELVAANPGANSNRTIVLLFKRPRGYVAQIRSADNP